jgi:hypothetical protein
MFNAYFGLNDGSTWYFTALTWIMAAGFFGCLAYRSWIRRRVKK